MLSYAFILNCSKKRSDLGEHINHFLDTVFLYLYVQSVNSNAVKDAIIII
jgi:hypothetical protein